MAGPSNNDMGTQGGIGWAFRIAGGVGLVFVLVHAAGGCVPRTIC